MRIALLVRVLVMNAMRGNPGNRTALQGKGAAGREDVLDPLGGLIPPVSEKTVIAHANAEASRNPPHKNGKDECFPGEKKDGREGTHMQAQHNQSYSPIYWLLKCSVAFDKRR